MSRSGAKGRLLEPATAYRDANAATDRYLRGTDHTGIYCLMSYSIRLARILPSSRCD